MHAASPASAGSELYIGLMSGTSLDGVDGVLVDLAGADSGQLRSIAHAHLPFEATFVAELLALNEPGADELHRAALASNALARRYAGCVDQLLQRSGSHSADVRAIGAHGQTIRHRPREFDGTGYTLQLLNAALLAELTTIDVVADLRSRDVAAGGQGAPLVPAFHRAVFGAGGKATAVLNIGGIANLTALTPGADPLGFDCGPGNVLMDLWISRHSDERYDAAGQWAASGTVHAAWLGRLLAEPYLAAPPPKSTGRDLFNAAWLDRHLDAAGPMPAEHVQATLAELTAAACASAIEQHAASARDVLVCGGGARNIHLMRRLAARLPGRRVRPSDAVGMPAEQVEALAFAWLARACVQRRPASLPSVTGAVGARILGAIHPGGFPHG